jgi:hypothetical protein
MQVWRVDQSATMQCRRCGGSFPPDHPAMGRLARAGVAVLGLAPCVEIEAKEPGVIRRRAFRLRPGRNSSDATRPRIDDPARCGPA